LGASEITIRSLVVVPSLLLYAEPWFSALLAIEARGSILDVSLRATLMRLGLPSWVRSVLWVFLLAGTLRITFARGFRLSREAAGLLISSSLLLAPYAAGNNLLTVIAHWVAPAFSSPCGIRNGTCGIGGFAIPGSGSQRPDGILWRELYNSRPARSVGDLRIAGAKTRARMSYLQPLA